MLMEFVAAFIYLFFSVFAFSTDLFALGLTTMCHSVPCFYIVNQNERTNTHTERERERAKKTKTKIHSTQCVYIVGLL